jgi:16S rRNA (uracil1498-N3)-methyltransferase
MHRFFAPAFDAGDDVVDLPREEGEHLTRVLRLGVGDTVSVFDGRGNEFLARVHNARRRDVQVQLLSRVTPAAESLVRFSLAQAVLKGEKMDDVIRDAVMLGVTSIQPVITRRTETTVAALVRGARLERWRRVALASTKQSKRAVVPEIRTPLTFENAWDEPQPALSIMLVEPAAAVDHEPPSATTRVAPISSLRGQPVPADVSVWIGPEGGWDAQEQALAAANGARLLSLGPRTLRADAVPVVAVSILNFLWDA